MLASAWPTARSSCRRSPGLSLASCGLDRGLVHALGPVNCDADEIGGGYQPSGVSARPSEYSKTRAMRPSANAKVMHASIE